MPESYPSYWHASPSTPLSELVAAAERAVELLRADRHYATAHRLEAAIAKVTGVDRPLSSPFEGSSEVG
jgi:hypothetical protein